MTTAFKVELLIIDHEGVGEDEVRALLENNKYLNIHVKAVTAADLGEWTDDHPLNKHATADAEYRRLFDPKPSAWVYDPDDRDDPDQK